ncbi:hypothetical protein H4R34_001174 [Dimargaris verticillata]|uniref:Uncharacterized protein n=1 Tax=Dimargaris verticillata TaxID=2761393 RepID=A0A9W8EER0_9FUNG|nr:hypothetical protein H4R34_001174 [Dimargaris verticillata]
MPVLSKRHARMAAASAAKPGAKGPAKPKSSKSKSNSASPVSSSASGSGQSTPTDDASPNPTPHLASQDSFPDLTTGQENGNGARVSMGPNALHEDHDANVVTGQTPLSRLDTLHEDHDAALHLDNPEDYPPVQVNEAPQAESLAEALESIDPPPAPEPVHLDKSFAAAAKENTDAPPEPTIVDVDEIEQGHQPSFAEAVKEHSDLQPEAPSTTIIDVDAIEEGDQLSFAEAVRENTELEGKPHPRSKLVDVEEIEQGHQPSFAEATKEESTTERAAAPLSQSSAPTASNAPKASAVDVDEEEFPTPAIAAAAASEVPRPAPLESAAHSTRQTANMDRALPLPSPGAEPSVRAESHSTPPARSTNAPAAHPAKPSSPAPPASAEKQSAELPSALEVAEVEIISSIAQTIHQDIPNAARTAKDAVSELATASSPCSHRKAGGGNQSVAGKDDKPSSDPTVGRSGGFCPVTQGGWMVGALSGLLASLLWKRNPTAAKTFGLVGLCITAGLSMQWTWRKLTGRS